MATWVGRLRGHNEQQRLRQQVYHDHSPINYFLRIGTESQFMAKFRLHLLLWTLIHSTEHIINNNHVPLLTINIINNKWFSIITIKVLNFFRSAMPSTRWVSGIYSCSYKQWVQKGALSMHWPRPGSITKEKFFNNLYKLESPWANGYFSLLLVVCFTALQSQLPICFPVLRMQQAITQHKNQIKLEPFVYDGSWWTKLLPIIIVMTYNPNNRNFNYIYGKIIA